jgi:hypothetical protein
MERPDSWIFACVAACLAGPVHAQAPPSSLPAPGQLNNRPVVSPYLNLARPGASPAFNYFTLVRPQIAASTSIQQLQQQTQSNQQLITQLQDQPPVPATGHASAFMNVGGNFMNYGASFMSHQGAGSRPSPAAGAPPPTRRGRMTGR